MKLRMKITAMLASAFMCLSPVHASTLMQYELGDITLGSGAMLNGTVYFVSYGVDGVLNSSISALATAQSTSLVAGDDKWLFANSVVGGNVQGNWTEQYSTGIAAGQSIVAFFVNNLTETDVNYSSGLLLNSKNLGIAGSGGSELAWGSYRTASVETLGGQVGDAIAWVLPTNVGSTASIIAYSGTGDYTGNDFNANLVAVNTVALVPEPSTGALMMIGAAGLVALRRLRKV